MVVETINPEVKQYVESYGFENWSSKPTDDEQEYEVSAEKVKRTVKAIRTMKSEKKKRDIQAFDEMVAKRVLVPAHRRGKVECQAGD